MRTRHYVLVVAGAAAAAILALDWPAVSGSADESTSAFGAPPRMARAAPPMSGDQPVAVERTVTGVTTISVRDPAGLPVSGADVLPWPATDPRIPASQQAPIANTDGEGRVAFDSEAVPVSRSLWIRRRGFAPHRIVAVVPDSTHHVVLHPAATCSVSVADESGVPVEGFAVALSRTDAPTAPDCVQPGAAYHAYGGASRQDNPACFGRTNRGGRIEFEDLRPGSYFVSPNFDQGPFLIANASECIAVEVPGELRIVTRRLWAAVVELVGDDVLAAGFDRGPASSVGWIDSPTDIRALRHATERLEALHPGCRILVGPVTEGREPKTRMAVCGATSGWSNYVIPLSPLSEVTRHTILVAGGSQAAARTRVHLVDARNNEIVDCSGARVNLGWGIDGVTTFLEVQVGTEIAIPAGTYDISAAGELPPGCFPATRRTATAGVLDEVRISVPSALRRYAIEVRRPDGSSPTQFGFSISWLDSIRSEAAATWRGGRPTTSILTVLDGRHSFLSTAPTHACRIYVKGYEPYSLDLRAGSGTVEGGVETFVVNLPDPVD